MLVARHRRDYRPFRKLGTTAPVQSAYRPLHRPCAALSNSPPTYFNTWRQISRPNIQKRAFSLSTIASNSSGPEDEELDPSRMIFDVTDENFQKLVVGMDGSQAVISNTDAMYRCKPQTSCHSWLLGKVSPKGSSPHCVIWLTRRPMFQLVQTMPKSHPTLGISHLGLWR